ncbi:nucleoside 2-deoxyribosyltransferase [Sphaerisporangium sp. NPDC088356]|uniref:nucleoside 2-deoxyribosyltransferase n=1 Tax=Sphaerisporangium sp. NPDC088356 TaxID=3154871 RepID=UPI003430146C
MMTMDPAFAPRCVVYLAGPDVFFPDAGERAEKARNVARRLGIQVLAPVDGGASPPIEDEPAARRIFMNNVALIDRADAVVANITPFRGPSADVGTVWEIGYACGRGMPVFAYSSDLSEYRQRVEPDGLRIENFGGVDNLMITQSIAALRPSLEDALSAVARHYASAPPHGAHR